MSTNLDRSEAPRSSDSAPIRRVRLRALPAVASLEDRKLMTGGFGMAMGPMEMASNGPAEVAQFSRPAFNAGGPQLSFRGDFVNSGLTSSSTDSADGTAWVNAGAAAQLGPYANLIYAAGDELSGPFEAKAPTTDSSDDASDADTLKAAFDQLRSDTRTIQDNSEVTPRLLAALRSAQNTLATAATGTVDSEKLTTFQDDQKTIIESGTFTADQQATLKADYTAVLQSAGVSDDAVTAYFNALDAVKTASNVTADNLTTLATDRQSLQDLLDAQKQDGVPSQDQSLPSTPGGWTQGMSGISVGMGGFAVTGPQGGGTGSQTAPIGPQGGGFGGQQRTTTFSLQQQQQATTAVAQQDAAVDEQSTPDFTQANGVGGQQQATQAVAQQQNGGVGGRRRTMQARVFQAGSSGMANRMASIRFNGGGAAGRSASRGWA